MAFKQVKLGQHLGGKGMLGHANCSLDKAAGNLDAKQMVDRSLALQLDVALQVLEQRIHGGLGVCGDEEVVHVDTYDLNSFFGMPSE